VSAPTNLAERQAQTLLEQTSAEALLDTYAALTHRQHAAKRVDGVVPSDLLVQRDMVRREILRRMDGRIKR
jgi:hypothetical protein